ncbi:MAG: hypothetical protein QW291_07495 [Thermofilaceae archaeon]
MDPKTIANISLFTALAVSFRLLKHVIAGAFQLVNFPLSFAMIAGYFSGSLAGMLTGALSFYLSDLLLGLGPWTLVNSTLAAGIGAVWGVLRKSRSMGWPLFILAFISTFAYDVLSSFLLYMLFIRETWYALVYALIGLFLPSMGGYMVGVGPITETLTAGVTTLVISRVRKAFGTEKF